jgi:Lrp/AsnC family leucine-responsive transcriptional regulator
MLMSARRCQKAIISVQHYLTHTGGNIVEKNEDYERILSTYYGENQVVAMMMLKIDTKEAENIAKQVSKFEIVEELFMVTGDVDIILKARFPNYKALKSFVLDSLAPINGIKETKTMMVVTPFKENGTLLFAQ